MPAHITTHGFAELPGLIDAQTCEELNSIDMKSAVAISNAFQKDVRGKKFTTVARTIEASQGVRDAVQETFGTATFQVTNLKVLVARAGSEPQIPHADDHCNRELFGIVHLKPNQALTEAVQYDPYAPYPSGVMAQCEVCAEWRTISDVLARRRDHVRGKFSCAVAGAICIQGQVAHPCPLCGVIFSSSSSLTRHQSRRKCASNFEGRELSKRASADTQHEDTIRSTSIEEKTLASVHSDVVAVVRGLVKKVSTRCDPDLPSSLSRLVEPALEKDYFAGDLAESFSDLIWRPDLVLQNMRPCGPPANAGDAIIALPTLVHRGPGSLDDSTDRWVLFFTVRPLFDDVGSDVGHVGSYDAAAQIHAGWLLFRLQYVLKKPSDVLDAYSRLGYHLKDFGVGQARKWKD